MCWNVLRSVENDRDPRGCSDEDVKCQIQSQKNISYQKVIQHTIHSQISPTQCQHALTALRAHTLRGEGETLGKENIWFEKRIARLR